MFTEIFNIIITIHKNIEAIDKINVSVYIIGVVKLK